MSRHLTRVAKKHRKALMLTIAVFTLLADQTLHVGDVLLPSPTDEFHYPVPYLMFTGQPNVDGHNELGYKGAVPPSQKAGEHRILMLGNSTLYNSSIASQLQALAHDNGYRNTDFYDWSVISENSAMEADTILHRALDYAPDLIITYDGATDFSSPLYYDPRPDYPFNFGDYERGISLLQGNDPLSALAILAANSHLLRTLFGSAIRARLNPPSVRNAPDLKQKIVASYLSNTEHSCQLAIANGATFIAFLQPEVYTKKYPTNDEKAVMLDEERVFIPAVYDQARNGFAALAEKYAGRRCFFIDFSHAYDGYSATIFYDHIHVTPEGSSYTARSLFEVLDEHRLLGENDMTKVF